MMIRSIQGEDRAARTPNIFWLAKHQLQNKPDLFTKFHAEVGETLKFF